MTKNITCVSSMRIEFYWPLLLSNVLVWIQNGSVKGIDYSRESETRARVKIIPREKGETGRLESYNLRSRSIFVSLCNNIPAGKAKRKQILAVAVRENVWEPLKLGLISGYSLNASRLSRVGWFSRALAFPSFYYPRGNLGTTLSDAFAMAKKTDTFENALVWAGP